MTATALRSLTASALVATLGAGCLAGCGSSSSGTGPSSATPAAQGSAGQGAPTIEYDGPEKNLPTQYTPTKPSKPVTVGFQIIHQDSGQTAEAAAVKAEVESAGGQVIVKDDQGSATTQVNNCNTLIAQKVDAIIVYPFDAGALRPCFKAAADAGIKIVAQQTPVNASSDPLPQYLKSDVIQGFDYAAYLRAKAIAEAAPGSTYAYLGLSIPVAALNDAKGRMIYWADRFGLKHVGDADAQGPSASDASNAMTSLLGKYPTVKNVFVFTVDSALAASTVARASGKTAVHVIGYNGTAASIKAIKAGTMFATVLVDVRTEGKTLADVAIGLIAGATPPKFLTTPNTMVTSANADSVTPIG